MSPIYFTFRALLPKPHSPPSHHRLTHHRTFFVDATTTKWVRDRGLDHAVEREKNLRPLMNIKNFIKSEPSKSLPISIIAQNRESLMIPTRPIDFVRKYPSIFEEFLPGGVVVHPHVRLTGEVLDLDAEEELMYQSESYKQDVADRLLKLLMLVRANKFPVNVIERLKWDLGLPPDYQESVVPEFPDYFNLVVGKKGASETEELRDLELVCWRNELAISGFEKKASAKKKGKSGAEEQYVFPMEFSRGFEMDKKLKKWIDEWQRLPYVSPYENAAHLSTHSDEADKWVVAVMHEFLHILVPKKTDRENLLCLGEHLGLRSRFKQALLRHPGIFYLSNKIGAYTVVLREGYKRGVMVENHRLMNMRSQYIHLMNTVKEDSKMIIVPGGSTREKKEVLDPVANGRSEEDENDESEEELEGKLCDSSNDEVEYDEVDDDSDKEDEDESQRNAVNNRGRRGRKSDFDGKAHSQNAEGGRSVGRRSRKSDFDGKAPSRNAERGGSGGRRARKSDFYAKPPSRNAERERSGGQHPGKSGNVVSPETPRRTHTDARRSIRHISRDRSNLSQSKGRSLPDQKTSV